MGTVTDINANQPHRVFEALCVACIHRWIAVAPVEVPLKAYECPGCGNTGATINTGQEISR